MIPTPNAITTAIITVKVMIVVITMEKAMCADTSTVKGMRAATRKAMKAADAITESKQEICIVLEPKYSRLRFPTLQTESSHTLFCYQRGNGKVHLLHLWLCL